VASEHSNSEAFHDFIRIQPGGHTEGPPGIVVVALEKISVEYGKADKDAGDMLEGYRSRGVQQVPLVLTVKGPVSLRRGGIFDNYNDTTGPLTEGHPEKRWNQESYKVTIGKQGSS